MISKAVNVTKFVKYLETLMGENLLRHIQTQFPGFVRHLVS